MTHILITRPLESSRQLASMVEARGLNAIIMPQYDFAAKESGVDLNLIWSEPGGRKLAVFSSPRAVQYGLAELVGAHISGLELAAIGPATRTKLESSGHKVHLQAKSGYTSEDFLLMPELVEESGIAVIFCAPDGRGTLVKGLQELGWQVEVAEVYQRWPLSIEQEQFDALTRADDLISVWTSISAIEIARKQLPVASWNKILNAPVLAISARLCEHLQQAGARLVEQSDGPGNADILRSVVRLCKDRDGGGAAV